MTEGRNNDPHPGPGNEDFAAAEQPLVGRASGGVSVYFIVAGFVVAAIILFFVLNSRRDEQAASPVTADQSASASAPAPPPPPLDVPAPLPPPSAASPPPVTPVAVTPPIMTSAPNDELQRLHAPAMVVDLQSVNGVGAPVAAPSAAGAIAAGGGVSTPPAAKLEAGLGKTVAAAGDASALLASSTPSVGLGANEQFAERVSSSAPEPAVATQLTGLNTIITQGATIPGVLETALNSDLPGYTRAVVSRDVRSFDGKSVLIPRGSRLIGQYRSALSLGQSRVFVIWTRVIRPDGVSIEIGSPGDDNLGRGGLSGDVNTHFFARFGSSILLSVLNGGIAAIAGTPATQISIGSPAAAVGAASTATLPGGGSDIMPTITVKQGVPINIFVARDLDFSAVKPFQ